ncbi:hypothetical protein HPB51_008014 [Rhipicephalus microplus]|uniref:CCHC-type domain-containing protein n=1 Tax=Rhipicephalus microplus TaxID=6941 RepID=A0A9J6EFS5_RHIMP|nr:hypothetical protein HPB51_008014 [Rhipicephalus microplus]
MKTFVRLSLRTGTSTKRRVSGGVFKVRVTGELALVVVPGRAMQCLRCHGTGHVRRDCKVLLCSKCRLYGHVYEDCVRTYASATGLPKTNEHEELMDVAEAEEAARGSDEICKSTATPDAPVQYGSEALKKDDGDAGKGVVPLLRHSADELAAKAKVTAGATGNQPAPRISNLKGTPEPQLEKGCVQTRSTASVASKRPDTQTTNDGSPVATTGVEEPPAKTPPGRRPSIQPRPNVQATSAAATLSRTGKSHQQRWRATPVLLPYSHGLDAGGRPPLCVRCRATGYIRREWRVPRCGLCRSFGHDETQCVAIYANLTCFVRSKAMEEHFMNQADAEKTVKGGATNQQTTPTSSRTPAFMQSATQHVRKIIKARRMPNLPMNDYKIIIRLLNGFNVS